MSRRTPPIALHLPLRHAPETPRAPLPAPPPQLSVSQWAAQALHFQPDPLQAQILDSPSHRLILLCARQFGKSTLAAIKALHFALTHPGATILCVSPTLRRSTEWLRLVQHFFSILTTPASPTTPLCPQRTVPTPPRSHRGLSTVSPTDASATTPAAPRGHSGLSPHPPHPPHPTKPTTHSLTLHNRSRILALPGTSHSNRGYSAQLLLFEEAAFIPDPVFAALTPSVAATGGAIWLISSAGSPSGFFYDIWTRQDLPYTRVLVSAEQCPRITQEHLKEARLALGELRFRREYLCEFSPDAIPIFSAELLESSLDPSFEPWFTEEAA